MFAWLGVVIISATIVVLASVQPKGQASAVTFRDFEPLPIAETVPPSLPRTTSLQPSAAVTQVSSAQSSTNPHAALNDAIAAWAGNEIALERGASFFKMYCSACHDAGVIEAGSTADLFDGKWVTVSDPASIEATISQGKLDAGMPPMAAAIEPADRQKIVAYILSQNSAERPAEVGL